MLHALKTSHRATLALRVTLTLLLAAGLMNASGCASWGKKDDASTRPVEPVVAPTPSDVPDDNPAEGPRPGDLLPMPEMNVIYFDYNKHDLRADQLDRIEANLKFLLDNPALNVMVEGNCDERGTVEYNLALGEKRAKVVRDYFVKGGVLAARVSIISKGEEEPAVLGHTETAWAKNRRCEFKRIY